jgi:signal transduction histidine kinase
MSLALRVLRSPLTVFLTVSLLLAGVIFFATSALADRTARDVSLEQAESITELVVETGITGKLKVDVLKGDPLAVERFLRKVGRLDVDAIDSYDIISADGDLAVDSADPSAYLEDKSYPLTAAQREVLESGGTVSSVADPDSTRNQDRAGDEAGLIAITTYTEATYGEDRRKVLKRRGEPLTQPALFVAYWELEGVERRQSDLFASFRWITLGPLILLVAVSVLMLGLLNGQVRRGSRERERLLQTAIDASDAERRRIARDLHDGVVQDLAGSGFALSGAARDPDTTPQTAAVLDAVGASLRDSLKQMRSLLAEIHPPDLHGQGLQAALDDLIAPAAAAGIHASTSVTGVENASGPEVALVWRVAQEAVRNATRHSGASTLAVTVRADEEQLLLEVVDDGVGFDTTAPSEPDRFGLRGLRSLVRDVGGELKVDSAVGEGTSVRMAVRR